MVQTFGFRKNVSKKSFKEVMDEFKRANSVRAKSASLSNVKSVEVFFFGQSNNLVEMLILSSFGGRSAWMGVGAILQFGIKLL